MPPPDPLRDGVLVFVGGGVGAVVRWIVATQLWPRPDAAAFPWATFAINALGSAALGVLAVATRDRPEWRLLLGVGFCGGFTTFSTFAVESLDLLARGRTVAAVGYALGSVVVAIGAAALAMKCSGTGHE
jgi:fluoride exporter